MRRLSRILVIFLLLVLVGVVLALKALIPAHPRDKYGLTIKGGGTPPSRCEFVLIDLCHVLHIRTEFDEEIDEAKKEARELMEQSEERARLCEQEQEKVRKSIEEQSSAWLRTKN